MADAASLPTACTLRRCSCVSNIVFTAARHRPAARHAQQMKFNYSTIQPSGIAALDRHEWKRILESFSEAKAINYFFVVPP